MEISRKHFKTNAKKLFSRINIQEENIYVFAKNNNLSKYMTERLVRFYKFLNKVQETSENIDLDEAIKTFDERRF
jgi:hypothetical protein